MGEPLYELDQAGLAALAEARAGTSGGSVTGGDLVLLYHYEGFMDAGHAAEQVVDHIFGERFQFEGAGEHGEPGNPVLARFDTDRLVDYRAQRPTMTFDTDRWSEYEAPRLEVKLAHDAIGTPFLVMYGPEPDTEWERFSAAMVEMIERLGVTLSVNFHGIPFAVPHTRPTTLIPHGNRRDLLAGYTAWFDRAQVPGSAMALVEFRLSEREHAVLGLAAQIPHYISRSPYPAAAVRILEAITSATGLVLPVQELHEQAQRVEAEIEAQVAQGDDDLRSMIRGLEVQYDTVAGTTPQADLLAEQAARIPTAEELARQFEQFLAEQDRDGEH
ncbi:PAC2 family protein [Actinocrinis puniceicyclus]|uniref:PAC2 family protein n=1 Tax=Actinocrinis puniceicyclus TaxID=977794 RepID=A0A8J7WN35_9ACTN|nr:PAC2 family protein [Actinocrinis puniceicyclus]MBS2964368.1 PAC2 family protein [Actinocrinis puniceicyclus]